MLNASPKSCIASEIIATLPVKIPPISSKTEKAKLATKGILIGCLCVAFGTTAYLSVAAATGTLMPPKVVTAFNPDMNGYYADIKADNGDIYTGDFVAGYYDGEGKIIYGDFSRKR